MMIDECRMRLAQLQAANPALRLYALVEGLTYQLHEAESSLEAQAGTLPLLCGTPDEKLAHAGPWLVDPELATAALCRTLERLEQVAPSVSWIIAAADINELAAMLRERLDIRLPDGRIAMLRFWDPRVLATLARDLEPLQRHAFFGDIAEWHLLIDGRRAHIARAHADSI